MSEQEPEWMPLMKACKEFDVSIHVIRRFVREEGLQEKENPRDKREKLINVTQLKRILWPASER